MRGARGLPIRTCKLPGCGQAIIFLANRKTGKGIPVNPETLSDDDRAAIAISGRGFDVDFDIRRHQVHRVTCKGLDRSL